MASVKTTVKSAVTAGLYAALVTALSPISFAVFQVRVADALLLLPFLDFFGLPAVIGLTIGCALANLISPFGVYDVVLGSTANLIAGLIAWVLGRRSKSMVALISAAILQSLVIATIIGYVLLHLLYGVELILAFIGVLVGSIISICLLGTALVTFIMRGMKIH
ncbi:MAG: QueT transporter family protein [Candidatus Nezhaarchaeota archaeon]|nr:QueT transporter family protein [Candidatus Nezhaarchaeota archaeon]MCX8141600.1 QueT transporter family protein [Candidatus Nezhaarchaeota archaeon]MDW8049867.1 QueT transporter family protein [Nitrososphaerota archaeon]